MAFRELALALTAMYLCTAPASAEILTGQASVIDGDTLAIHGTRIRLWGIDAPESSQLCRGEDSSPFSPVSLDQYGRTVAVCSIAGVDLAEWKVRNGLALDRPMYSKAKYDEAQRDAERAGRGIWGGTLSLGCSALALGGAEDQATVRTTRTRILKSKAPDCSGAFALEGTICPSKECQLPPPFGPAPLS
jgi:endonuclease YncB( thermonuclease family)